MYNNQDYQQQPEQHKSVYTSSLELLAIIIAFLMSALFGTYAAYFTLPLILSIALPVFGSGEEDFIKGTWLLASHLLIFFGVLFFAHLKLTVFGTKVVMKPFKEDQQPPKKRGGFLKLVGFLTLMFALFSLTGCDEDSAKKRERLKIEHEHIERMQKEDHKRDVEIAIGNGEVELQKQTNDLAHNKIQWQKFYDFIEKTISPLAQVLATLAAFVAVTVIGVKQVCDLFKTVARERTKQIWLQIVPPLMNEEERSKFVKEANALSGQPRSIGRSW